MEWMDAFRLDWTDIWVFTQQSTSSTWTHTQGQTPFDGIGDPGDVTPPSTTHYDA